MDVDHETTTRLWKAGRLLSLFEAEHLTCGEVAHFTVADWAAVAGRAGVNAPSRQTRLLTLAMYAGSATAPRAAVAKHARAPHGVARR